MISTSFINQKACLDYLMGRQTPDGGFCYYRAYGVEESNGKDTYSAVAGLLSLQAQVPDSGKLVTWLHRLQNNQGAPAGARYLEAVGRAIDLIERESEAIRPRRRGPTLRLSVLQSFASLWLLPRLAAFRAVRPDIDVLVETSSELVDLGDDRFDAAIRFGEGRWPGLLAERLFEVRVMPVAAPGLLPEGVPVSAAALDKTTLFHISQAPDLWPQYLAG
ncbi:MAG: LysR substrate-binding domain-containing protein, partial [Methylobacter sp.]